MTTTRANMPASRRPWVGGIAWGAVIGAIFGLATRTPSWQAFPLPEGTVPPLDHTVLLVVGGAVAVVLVLILGRSRHVGTPLESGLVSVVAILLVSVGVPLVVFGAVVAAARSRTVAFYSLVIVSATAYCVLICLRYPERYPTKDSKFMYWLSVAGGSVGVCTPFVRI